jgi:hypothetical protein
MKKSVRFATNTLKPFGLEVAVYNPGDGPSYKIVPVGVDYFATDGLYRSRHLRDIMAFAEGFKAAKCGEAALYMPKLSDIVLPEGWKET